MLLWHSAGTLAIRDGSVVTITGIGGVSSNVVFHEKGAYELLHFTLSTNRAPATPKDLYGLYLYLKAEPGISVQ